MNFTSKITVKWEEKDTNVRIGWTNKVVGRIKTFYGHSEEVFKEVITFCNSLDVRDYSVLLERTYEGRSAVEKQVLYFEDLLDLYKIEIVKNNRNVVQVQIENDEWQITNKANQLAERIARTAVVSLSDAIRKEVNGILQEWIEKNGIKEGIQPLI